MITKEQFLRDTSNYEVFSLIHEFKERLLEMDAKNRVVMVEYDKNKIVILDKTLAQIAEDMIEDVKGSVYLE